MKSIRIPSCIATLLVMSLPFAFHAQHLQWAYTYGSPQWDDTGGQILADDSGHVYLMGQFYDEVDFDLGPGEFMLDSDNGSSSIFIVKMDTSAGFIWARKIGGYNGANPSKMAFDNEGNLVIAGEYDDVIDADPGIGTFTLNEVPGQNNNGDSFILKLNSNGEFIWAKTFGSVSGDMVRALFIDSENNIYAAGSFMQTIDLDPGEGVNEFNADWNYDAYIMKLDSNGDHVWGLTIGSEQNSFFEDITLDANGNLRAAGYYSGTIDFDPGSGVQESTAPNQSSAFILNLDTAGVFNSVLEFGGPDGYSNGGKMLFDAEGNMYFSASLSGTIDVDPGVGVLNLTGTTNQSFLIKLDAQSNLLWARSTQGTSSTNIHTMALHPDGYLILAGAFLETADLDMGDGVDSFTANGSADLFMMHVSSDDGSHIWATSSGNYYIDAVLDVYVDASGNTYTSGIIQSTVDVDPGPGIYTLNAYGAFDCFITRLGACSSPAATEPMTGPASACAGSTSAVFNCEPATGASEIVWTVPDGSTILSGQNSTAMQMAMGSNNGQVTATIHYSCHPSVAYNLEVVSLPVPLFTLQPADLSVTVGEDALFTVQATPAEASFQWYTQTGTYNNDISDGPTISGSQTDSLTRYNVPTNQNNMHFFCIVTLDGCSDTSEVATLTVLPTDISDINADAYLLAFPNPVNDMLYMQCGPLARGISWQLKDSFGRVVATGKFNAAITTIDMNDLSPGVYFLQWEGPSGNNVKIVNR